MTECPFCQHRHNSPMWCRPTPGKIQVCCGSCGATGPLADEQEEALMRWNSRPALKSACVCGEPLNLGIVHRKDGPCYVEESNGVQKPLQVMADEHWGLSALELARKRRSRDMDNDVTKPAPNPDDRLLEDLKGLRTDAFPGNRVPPSAYVRELMDRAIARIMKAIDDGAKWK